MKILFSDIVGTMINFLIIFLILRHFLFNKVNALLDERNNNIKDNLTRAEENRKTSETMLKEQQERLLQSKEEGKRLLEEFKAKAETLSSEIIGDASKEAELIIERATKESEREREKLKDELRTQVVDLAILAASRALEETLDEEKHRQLIEEFISRVGA